MSTNCNDVIDRLNTVNENGNDKNVLLFSKCNERNERKENKKKIEENSFCDFSKHENPMKKVKREMFEVYSSMRSEVPSQFSFAHSSPSLRMRVLFYTFPISFHSLL